MKITGKKNILLAALFIVLVSCGGGGGGGGGSTSATPTNPTSPTIPTPTNPTTPTVPTETSKDANGNIKWNDTSFKYNKNNPHNKTSSVTQTGSGVTVGILDMGYATLDGDLQGIMTTEFGTRLEKVTTYGKATNNQHHGITVAQVTGSAVSGTANGVKIIGVDITKEKTDSKGKKTVHPDPTLAAYNYLYNKGVRIYNQSFGIDDEVTTFNQSSARYQINNGGTEEILGFYKTAVDNGALFIWAAGNDRFKNNPSLEGGLPYVFNELEKGWINVVGLAKDRPLNPGSTDWSDLDRLNGAGVAKNWTVTAVSGITVQSKVNGVKGIYEMNGSSFAAPIVTGTAALIKEKYPWMTGDLIRQTILSTATDIGKKGVDEDFGWGLLNIGKALNGPALFDKRLALGNNVVLDVTPGTYIFGNNISGDAGVIKDGAGDLILSGNSTFTGDTTVNNGRLQVNGVYASSINVRRQAILSTNSAIIKNNIKNDGTIENFGSTEVAGNYESLENSRIVTDLNSNIHVKGKVNLNNSKLEVKPEQNGERKYITSNGTVQNVITSDDKIQGNVTDVNTDEMLNTKIDQTENSVSAKVSRKNVLDYVEKISESDEMQKNTAQNLETAFQKLDQDIENGTSGNVTQFERKAAKLQALTSSNRAAVLDSLSGQIYASAQALTFQHSQTVNKDLSNRLVMLGTLDNVGDKFGLWISGLGANGKLKQDGYGKGSTKVYGGQVGVDKQFGDNLILGTALSYSKADVKFDRYGGKSDANNFGISLYGRLGNKDVPVYLQGRLGVGFVDSDVERDIILSSNDYTRAKINHNDKVYSGYLETGYDVKNANGDFVVTPFVGLTHDTVVRGSFSEEKSQFGLTADKKNYNQTAALVGLRAGKAVNWKGGSKTTFQGYVTHQRAFNKQDLSFDARYTGLPGATFKVKGIGLAKNKTWAGVGALTEVNKDFGWYVNYDGSVDGGKGKGNNNVFTTGVRFNF